jgi:hypothetical protein
VTVRASGVAHHDSIGNLTPADVYFGRGRTILIERERIKRQTQPPLAAPVMAGMEATTVSTTACMGACRLRPHLIVATHLSHGSRAGGQTAPGGIDTLCQYRRY